MIYDFVDDSNLELSIKIKFKQKLLNEFNNYSKYLSSFSNKHKESLDWWVSLPASRNNFTSDIYYNFCICEFIKDELSLNKKISKIVVSNKITKNILNKIIKQNNLDIKIELNKKKLIFSIKFFLRFTYVLN